MNFSSKMWWSMAAVAVAATGAAANDWPHFMGPDGSSVIANAGVSRTWPADGPKELWAIPVGTGFGGPAIVGGKIYFLDRPNGNEDKFVVLDLATGKEIWSHTYRSTGTSQSYPGSRSTPTVEGDFAYTIGVFGALHCYDLNGKKTTWTKDIEKDFRGDYGAWGYAQSPLIYKDSLIFLAQSDSVGAVALNKKTGAELWRTAGLGGSEAYTSPRLATIAGVEQVIVHLNGQISGLNPETGAVLWKYTGYSTSGGRPCSDPLVLPGDKIFVSSGYRKGSAMIQLSHANNRWSVRELQNGNTETQARLAPLLLYKDHIYTNSSDSSRKGVQCLNLDGTIKWQSSGIDLEQGSMMIADGLIFALGGNSGVLHLIQASPDGYKPIARAQVLGKEEVWAHLVIADGKLILKDKYTMKCLDVSAAAK